MIKISPIWIWRKLTKNKTTTYEDIIGYNVFALVTFIIFFALPFPQNVRYVLMWFVIVLVFLLLIAILMASKINKNILLKAETEAYEYQNRTYQTPCPKCKTIIIYRQIDYERDGCLTCENCNGLNFKL